MLGQLVKWVQNLDKEQSKNSNELEKKAKKKMIENKEFEATSMAWLFQDCVPPDVMQLVGTRIEIVFEFNLEKDDSDRKIRRDTRWCSGVIKEVCKGIPGHKQNINGYSHKYFKAGEVEKVEQDIMAEVESNVEKETIIETLNPKKQKKM